MSLKHLLLFILATLSLWADASGFKETRYIYALDKNIVFEGFITFGEQNIIIEYAKPDFKVLTYFEGKLSIQDNNGFTMADATTPTMHYFFMIIQAVHDDNRLLLDSFFTATQKGNETILSPKGVTADILDEVIITKQNNVLKSLHVKIKNGDRITIDIMD